MSHFNPSYRPLLEQLSARNEVSDRVCFRRHQGMGHTPHSQQLAWDVVVCDVVSPQGNLREGIFEKLAHVKLVFSAVTVDSFQINLATLGD